MRNVPELDLSVEIFNLHDEKQKPGELILSFPFQKFHEGELIKVALYNITADPTEHNDLSQKFPDVLKKLQERLEFYKKTAVPPLNKPVDIQAWVVAKKNGIWTPWRS